MAHQRNDQTTRTGPKAPEFLAWHVADKGEKSFWTKVGAAWRHKDGRGFTLQLETLPINGRIVLREPVEDPAAPVTEKEGGA